MIWQEVGSIPTLSTKDSKRVKLFFLLSFLRGEVRGCPCPNLSELSADLPFPHSFSFPYPAARQRSWRAEFRRFVYSAQKIREKFVQFAY